MAMRPLDEEQQRAIDELVVSRRLERVPVDLRRATAFLEKARRRLEEVDKLSWPESRHDFAYDAAHDIGEALLAAHGLRTTHRAGQHEALGRFLRALLTAPPGQAGARRFEQMRRARNQQRYDLRVVGDADAVVAVTAARRLYEGAQTAGLDAPPSEDLV